MDQAHINFVNEKKLNKAFLHEVERKVNDDSIVSIDKIEFEVPQMYRDHRVTILFRADDLTSAYLKEPNNEELLPSSCKKNG